MITKSIQRMERWFGHALIERGAELKLTAFGAAMIGDAKRVLGGFDELTQAASLFGKNGAASLRIGAGPLIAETLVATAIGRLLGTYPGFRGSFTSIITRVSGTPGLGARVVLPTDAPGGGGEHDFAPFIPR